MTLQGGILNTQRTSFPTLDLLPLLILRASLRPQLLLEQRDPPLELLDKVPRALPVEHENDERVEERRAREGEREERRERGQWGREVEEAEPGECVC